MSTPTKFQKVDSYFSALCIGAAATVSFWFLFIGVVLGVTDSSQQKASFRPLPYAQGKIYDADTMQNHSTLHAHIGMHIGTRLG